MQKTTAILDHPATDRLFQAVSIVLGVILAAITVGAVIGWGTIPASSVVAVLLLDALYLYVALRRITPPHRSSRR